MTDEAGTTGYGYDALQRLASVDPPGARSADTASGVKTFMRGATIVNATVTMAAWARGELSAAEWGLEMSFLAV